MTMAFGEQTSLAERKRRAGQRLVLGIPGAAPTLDYKSFCRDVGPGGFILFSRNIEEPAQVIELNREVAELVSSHYPAWLTVDQEGGRVQRIENTRWPPMRALGNRDQLSVTRQVAVAMGTELRALGFDLDFAPVADVDHNPAGAIIGDRSFSGDPQVAARHVAAFVAGLHEARIAACAKHFPGHGGTRVDSHRALPRIDKDLDEIREVDLPPFEAAVKAGARFVLTAHVVYPAIDDEHPATMSFPVVQEWLRKGLGFDGVVCSDDLEMAAVREHYPLEQQLDLACRAGLDLFIVGKTSALMHEAFETLVRLQESDPTHDRLAIDSSKRLMAERVRFFYNRPPGPDLSVVGCMAHKVLAGSIETRGLA